MFCRACGKQVPDQAIMCVACGCPPRSGNAFCQNCGAPSNPAAQVCLQCGVGLPVLATGEQKSKMVAGLLGIFLGGFGVHRFYLGYTGLGIAQIAVTVFTFGIGGLWGFIEGIMILCGSSITTDAQGQPLKD
jgi:TM2 domain-containing membrane protein YozV